MKTIITAVFFCTFSYSNAQSVGIGTTNPQATLSVGANSPFRVDASGNIIRINDVPYNFPATQGLAGQALLNDGTGSLNWKPAGVPYGAIIMSGAGDTASLKAKGYVIEGISETFSRFLSPAPGTWTPFKNVSPTYAGVNMQNNPTVFTGTRVLSYVGSSVFSLTPPSSFWGLASANTVAGFGSPTNASAVWTGTDMIIYGGGITGGVSNKGVKYNPTTNTWTAIANGPIKMKHSAIWTGTEMIVFGGDSCSLCTNGVTRSIYRYNPTTNVWTSTTSSSGGPSRRSGHAGVWTGSQMVVFGGTDDAAGQNPAGGCFGYNPATGAWSFLASPPEYVTFPNAVWTGTEILSWGNIDITVPYPLSTNIGMAYNPTNNTWTRFATEGSTAMMNKDANAVWIGTHLMLIKDMSFQKFSYTGTGNYVSQPRNAAYYMMRNNQP